VTEVFPLLVETGRREGDGLPDGATGAALLCYAPAGDEAEAVRETVALLQTAGLDVLEVTADDDAPVDPELAAEAARRGAVIVAQKTPFFD
jgi:L-asparaginase II